MNARRFLFPCLLLPALLVAQTGAADDPAVDQIKARQSRGEKLTAEEQDYRETAEHQREAVAAQRNSAWAQAQPARYSTGLVPMPDLGGETYRGAPGGLDPGGENRLHEAGGERVAQLLLDFLKKNPTSRLWFQAQAAPARPAADGWERLPDGTLGRETEFHGVDGLPITAYVRKPEGPGPFPAIVWMHGGKDSKQATIRAGRSQGLPFEAIARQGWVIYSADYRHAEQVGIYPIEFDDTVKAVEAARALPYVDPKRVGYMGQSHGAQVGTRVVSRVDLSGAVIMAPAAMDFIEIKKAMKAGVKLVPILSKILADLEQKYGAPMEEIEKNPAKYGYTSGITEAARVRCPLLIENARDDDNSPPEVIAAWVKALRAAGKEVQTYEPDHGGHGFYFRNPPAPETEQAARLAVAFFQKVFATSK